MHPAPTCDGGLPSTTSRRVIGIKPHRDWVTNQKDKTKVAVAVEAQVRVEPELELQVLAAESQLSELPAQAAVAEVADPLRVAVIWPAS